MSEKIQYEDLHVSLSTIHYRKLKALAQLQSLSMSERIRRWIDEEYESQIDAGKRLEEMFLFLKEDDKSQGLGNIFHDKKTVQILKEDGSFQEINIKKIS